MDGAADDRYRAAQRAVLAIKFYGNNFTLAAAAASSGVVVPGGDYKSLIAASSLTIGSPIIGTPTLVLHSSSSQ